MRKAIGIFIFAALFLWLVAGIFLIFNRPIEPERAFENESITNRAGVEFDNVEKSPAGKAPLPEDGEEKLLAGRQESTEEEEMVAAASGRPADYLKQAAYYVKEEDGRLTIYRKEDDSVYLETNILFQELEIEQQRKIRAGLTFENDREMFDFLESYSS